MPWISPSTLWNAACLCKENSIYLHEIIIIYNMGVKDMAPGPNPGSKALSGLQCCPWVLDWTAMSHAACPRSICVPHAAHTSPDPCPTLCHSAWRHSATCWMWCPHWTKPHALGLVHEAIPGAIPGAWRGPQTSYEPLIQSTNPDAFDTPVYRKVVGGVFQLPLMFQQTWWGISCIRKLV